MKNDLIQHAEEIHTCIEKIINVYRQRMDDNVPHRQRSKHITITCIKIDEMLVYVKGRVAYHSRDHDIQWQAIVIGNSHSLKCEKCTVFFDNAVLEAARKFHIL